MTEQDNTTPKKVRKLHPERKRRVRSALKLFTIAAWTTGVMLLILCVEMVVEYILHIDTGQIGTWIAIVHGWIYIAFVVATFNLGLRARWSLPWYITTVLGGVVPFLSFYVENNRRKQVTERFQLDLPDA